ncbi:Polyprenol reductase [Caenorhabditis elegans]|uniref:Polyprenol reductase n=1 Tax=Caenorhabditis elegans TaxID=6239 RepID=Q4TTC8_CAEEL|nr:Polyprenol reductase [Caenorhabditis elegans]CCD72620.1 Polyprenol reductase [Caenorhabditis elegans]|eukprot:NP_001022659.1 Uncharacterized protein CELE_K04C2.7 [Caenorhabditis elegans]
MLRWFHVEDEKTFLFGIQFRNRKLVTFFALVQLVVASVSFAQHIYSVALFNKIFYCSFNETRSNTGHFLSHDVIIFDFGLFHELINVQECIANYLDGGYMRCLWCFTQMIALTLTIWTTLCIPKPHPLLLWPMLIIQNAYCFGLVILTIATADKLLVALFHPVNAHLNLMILYFAVGTSINHFFDYILWHYYWYEEFQYIGRTGKHVIPFWV